LAETLGPSLRRLAALTALCLIAVGCMPSGATAGQTVVSLTFDDGIASQWDVARPQLVAHGMQGTFYVNSGTVGTGSYYLTWSELDQLHAEGNEIAGHTANHVHLNDLTDQQVRSEICDDANALRSRGYQIIDFAYPHGAGYTNQAARAALAECGFVSARTYGGLRESWDCTSVNCPYSEPIPPPDPYRVRTPAYKDAPLSLEDLELSVRQALENGGGWVPMTFHEIDNSGGAATVTPSVFESFLDWLQASGAVVKTVSSVMGHSPAPEPPLPVRAFMAPDKVTAFASLKARKKQDVDSITVTAAMLEPGTLSAGGMVDVPGRARTSAARVFRLKRTSVAATPGKRVKLRLKLKKKALRAAKRAIRRHRRVRAKITVTATDVAGNRKSAKRTVRLVD
jgi:peptidoglycan/xylan/chitin deacetylase (PgdA/CDA1 family)